MPLRSLVGQFAANYSVLYLISTTAYLTGVKSLLHLFHRGGGQKSNSNPFLMKPDKAMGKSDLRKIKEMLSPVFIENKVKKAVLFGSFSRKSQTKKSDLDIMIITETDKRFFERYEYFSEIHEIVDDRAVDMLIYTPDELSSISHRPFIKRILLEGETIYES